MKFTILLKNEDDSTVPLTISQIERSGPLTAATLGLSLAESKQVLAKVQQALVEAQLHGHAQEQRICPQCGSRRTLKDYREACFKSLFGGVDLHVPRFYARAKTTTAALIQRVRLRWLWVESLVKTRTRAAWALCALSRATKRRVIG